MAEEASAVRHRRSASDNGDDRVSTKLVRDLVTIALAAALLLSQIVVQFMGEEPNIALIGAGVGLLSAVPAFHRGDRRTNNASG